MAKQYRHLLSIFPNDRMNWWDILKCAPNNPLYRTLSSHHDLCSTHSVQSVFSAAYNIRFTHSALVRVTNRSYNTIKQRYHTACSSTLSHPDDPTQLFSNQPPHAAASCTTNYFNNQSYRTHHATDPRALDYFTKIVVHGLHHLYHNVSAFPYNNPYTRAHDLKTYYTN